jgi:hypothetical protein
MTSIGNNHILDSVTIRVAHAGDQEAIDRLAALDSGRVPAAPVLVAIADGELRAARSLTDGSVVADPFARTAELVSLLAAHGAVERGGMALRRRRPKLGFAGA